MLIEKELRDKFKCFFCGKLLDVEQIQTRADFLGDDKESDLLVISLVCPKCGTKYDVFEKENGI